MGTYGRKKEGVATGESIEVLFAMRTSSCTAGFARCFVELGQQAGNHSSVYIGEPLVAAAVAEGEAFVVEAHLMEKGGVNVMNVRGIARDGIAELIGFAMGDAAFESAAGQEE